MAAAVNVSKQETDNFLADLDTDEDDDDDDDEVEPGDELSGDFRSILAEFDPDRGRPN